MRTQRPCPIPRLCGVPVAGVEIRAGATLGPSYTESLAGTGLPIVAGSAGIYSWFAAGHEEKRSRAGYRVLSDLFSVLRVENSLELARLGAAAFNIGWPIQDSL